MTARCQTESYGAAALAWSINPALSVDEVKQILFSTAVDLGEPGWDEFYGWGRVSLARWRQR